MKRPQRSLCECEIRGLHKRPLKSLFALSSIFSTFIVHLTLLFHLFRLSFAGQRWLVFHGSLIFFYFSCIQSEREFNWHFTFSPGAELFQSLKNGERTIKLYISISAMKTQ
ncbi:hypothetical protein GOODEAATRI_019430 [Goodea atripinnis]|uniref:Uncharacterized protein n=1 Tax=Goodea atripinnis TaxID=208336 RepID=A0ABV0P666_9TELE